MTTTENTQEAARKALAFFEDHPEKHDQATWIEANDLTPELVETSPDNMNYVFTDDAVNECGTTMCVAGLVQYQAKGYVYAFLAPHDGALILGLDNNQAQFLFYDADNDRALDGLRCLAEGDPWGLNDLMDEYYNPSKEWWE